MQKKLFLFMKQKVRLLLFASMFFLTLPALAQSGITLNVNNGSLKSVIEIISKQSNYRFVYTNDLKVDTYSVTVISKNENIKTLLDKIFNQINIKYQLKGTQVVLGTTQTSNSKRADNVKKTISGIIKDDSGEPLVGVAVKNENSRAFCVSGVDGKYSISAAEGDKLSFTLIGMETYTSAVGKGNTLNIGMKTDIIELGDVIVTGYQTISKERSAASFDIVKGENIKENAMGRGSILESLEGMATGLTVNLNPNAESKYTIRGITSINSSREPLFVLDGVPVGTTDVENLLSANDIASVTVLKDATAVSIWGSRAANGVIVITTKTGSNSNGKVDVSYDGSFTYKGKPNLDYYNLMDSKTFIKNATEVFEQPDYKAIYTWDKVTSSKDGLPTLGYDTPVVFPHEQILYDWQRGIISKEERDKRLNVLANQDGYKQYKEEMMSNMWNQSHNISLRSGTDKFKIYGSFGYDGS